MIPSVIKASSNAILIATIAPLWLVDRELVVDVTYGKGTFWKKWTPNKLIAHDWKTDGVDFRTLPEPDNFADAVVFDPPYTTVGGKATTTIPNFYEAYGLDTGVSGFERQLAMNILGLWECARILAPQGVLLVKCQDYIESGKYCAGRHRMVTEALHIGLHQVDEFIHLRGAGPQPKQNRDGTPRRQVHSRRVHSILCVFAKK